jgi:predicted ester cyclase
MEPDEIREFIRTAAETGTEGFRSEEARRRYVDMYDESVVLHGYPPGVEGKEGARAFYGAVWSALGEGGSIELEETLVEGDTAAVRFRLRGTHSAELMGVPASGNEVDVPGQSFIRVRDGKIVERFQAMDTLTLLQQIGAVPAPV